MTDITQKSSTLKNTFTTIEGLTLLSCSMMFVGFLCSRGLLSLGTISIGVLGLWPTHFLKGWQLFRKNVFAWLAVFFCLSYFISGLWSTDMQTWWNNVQLKLPFAFLPFALLNLPFNNKKLQLWIAVILSVALFGGIVYSLSFLIHHPHLFSKGEHLPTAAFEDYIRFTMALVLTMEIIFYLFKQKSEIGFYKVINYWFAFWLIAAIIYLHVQAAKSGLISFYLLLLIHGLYYLFKNKKISFLKLGGVSIAVMLLLFAGMRFTPSVHRQIKIFEKELSIWQQGDKEQFKAGYSVIPRLISYQMAWKAIQEKPLLGAGSGDLVPAMNVQYEKYYPKGIGKLMPHNQILTTAVRLGIPLTLVLIVMLLAPLFHRPSRMLVVTTIIMLMGVLIEAMFEIQLGVFIYLFFTSFWMSVFKEEKSF